MGKLIRCRQNAKDNHQAREQKSGDTQATMDVHAAGGNQGRLRDQQKNPARKDSTVQMDEQICRGALRTPAR